MADVTTRIEWYRTAVAPERLRELTQRKNLQPLLHVTGHVLVSAATAYFAFFAFNNLAWPFVVLAVYLHGTFYNFLGIFTGIHELAHRTVFKSRRLGEVIYFILGVLTWNNIYKFRESHFAHHRVTCHTGRDLEVVLPEKFRKRDWIFMFTITPFSGAGGVPGIVSLVGETVRYALGIFNREWETSLLPEEKGKERRRIFNYARLTLLVHLGLAVYFVLSGMWILLFVVTIGVFVAPWLAILCALPQHICLKGDTPDWRICARTVLMHPVIRFFYWNMNYHIEHHMYASVPFYNLPALHEEIKHDLPEPYPGLIAAWRDILPAIRRQREDPDYAMVPELPA